MKFEVDKLSRYYLWIFIVLSALSAFTVIRFVILQQSIVPVSNTQSIHHYSGRKRVNDTPEYHESVKRSLAKTLTSAVIRNPEFVRIDVHQKQHLDEAVNTIVSDQLTRFLDTGRWILDENDRQTVLDSVMGNVKEKLKQRGEQASSSAGIVSEIHGKMVNMTTFVAPDGYMHTVAYLDSLIHDYVGATLPEIQKSIATYDDHLYVSRKDINWVFGVYLRSRIRNGPYAFILNESKYPHMASAMQMLERDYSTDEPVQCVGWVALLNAIPGMYLAENIAGYALRPDARMIFSIIDAYNYRDSAPPLIATMRSRDAKLTYYAGQNIAYRFTDVRDIRGGDVGFFGNHTFAVLGLFGGINEKNPYGLAAGDYLLVSESNKYADGLPRTYFVRSEDFEFVVAPLKSTVFLRNRYSRPDVLEVSKEPVWTELPPVVNEAKSGGNRTSVPMVFKAKSVGYLMLHEFRNRINLTQRQSTKRMPIAELAAVHVEHTMPVVLTAWRSQKSQGAVSDWLVQSARFWWHALEILNKEIDDAYQLAAPSSKV